MDKYQSHFEKLLGKPSQAYRSIYLYGKKSKIRFWFFAFFISLTCVMFVPWTQNIRTEGKITTLRQEDRPQKINSIIAGKIVEWRVKEGDIVSKGDTLIVLAEVKDDYLDPQLLERTQEQLDAEIRAISNYQDKVQASESQIGALLNERDLKNQSLENKMIQAQRKLESDSMKWVAASNEMSVADRQLDAAVEMYEKGILSLVEFEKRKVTHQNAVAKLATSRIDLNNARQDLLIIGIEQNAVRQSYAEKIAKARGDQYASESQISAGLAKRAKLNNQYENYRLRSGQYVILAPQSGQVTKAAKAGLLEIVKEGEIIAEIVPLDIEKAVELWIKPMDIQLISPGQEVRFVFDGFPALVFSGWPDASYGIFSGKVTAIERNISANGKFRVLVSENGSYRRWPQGLSIGGGVRSFALLKDVPIWYEIWRQINGFPPDYYSVLNPTESAKK